MEHNNAMTKIVKILRTIFRPQAENNKIVIPDDMCVRNYSLCKASVELSACADNEAQSDANLSQ